MEYDAQLQTQSGVWRLHQTICKLPSVCSKFHDVLSEQPDICTSLSLCEVPAGDHLPHCLRYIQRHSGSIKQLWGSTDCPWLEVVLAILFTHSAPISNIDGCLRQQTLPLVVAFRTLTQLSIENEEEPSMSLKPLEALPNLTSLKLLSGDFDELDAAARHLTYLSLDVCTARSCNDCMCVTSLQELCCVSSVLVRFHHHGLPACSHLTSLTCVHSSIQGVIQAEHMLFHDVDHNVPANLSALTALSSLSLTCVAEVEDVEFGWLTGLTGLEELYLEADAGCVTLPECISSLSKIKELSLAVKLGSQTISIAFEFGCLVALEVMRVFVNFRAEKYGLWNLVTLKNLNYVRFSQFTELKKCMIGQLVSVAHKLGRARRDVQFIVDEEDSA